MPGRDLRQRLQYRVAGAQLFGLQRPLERPLREIVPHLCTAVAVDDMDGLRCQGRRRVQDVCQQRPAGQWLQYLRPCRAHPLALAGCQDDDAQVHARDGFLKSAGRLL